MAFSKDLIRKVSENIDIVSLISTRGVILKKAGASFKGLCPFHSEKTPSFNVNPQRGFFHCFGCGASGDAIKFLIQHDRLSFAESVEELAKISGIELEHERGKSPQDAISEDLGLKCLKETEHFYHQQLMSGKHNEALEYLHERMVSEEQWTRFQLGFAPNAWRSLGNHLELQGFKPPLLARCGLIKEHEKSGRCYDRFRGRLLFPIHDLRGRCVGFGGRAIREEDLPKYLNSPENPYYHKSQVLYGLFEGLEEIRKNKELICVEGYIDVIRLHEHGFRTAVAPCGTALTNQHMNLIKRYADQVVLLFDGDDAGREAVRKLGQLFLPHAMEASIVLLPNGTDPDSFLLDQGTNALKSLLEQRIPVLDYLVQQTLSRHPEHLQGRTKAIDELLPLLADISDQTLRQMTLNSLAEKMRVPIQHLLDKSRKFLKIRPDYIKINNLSTFSEESRDERWILQTLLNRQESASLVIEHLNPEELSSTRMREIYSALLQFSPETFAPFNPQILEEKNPQLYQAVMALCIEDIPQHEVLLSLKRIKERKLIAEYQDLRSQGSQEERLNAGIEHRRKMEELESLITKLSAT